jgi:hypothetical protein
MYIPDELGTDLPEGSYLDEYYGNRDHWHMTVRIPAPQTPSQINEVVNTSLTKWGQWTKVEGSAATESRWTFTDRLGVKWLTTIKSESDGSGVLLTLQMRRN